MSRLLRISLILLMLVPNLVQAAPNWWVWQTIPLQQLDAIEHIQQLAGRTQLAQEQATGTLRTLAFRSDLPFDVLNIRWQGSESAIWQVRTSVDGHMWDAWQLASEHMHHAQSADGSHSGQQLWFAKPQRFVQVALSLTRGEQDEEPWISDAELLLINRSAQPSLRLPASSDLTIVSRTDWGSPDGEASPNWEPEHYPVTHIVLHHTATSNTASDWAAVVRSIWVYHAVSQGWGDIGYHYLIDPNGIVYQGRAGGDTAEAGHAYTYNQGSIGIAWLGCFDSSCDDGGVNPSEDSLLAAEQLLYNKALQHGLNLAADATDVRGRSHAVLSGHNDLLATACPGDLLKPHFTRFFSLAPLRMYAPMITRGS